MNAPDDLQLDNAFLNCIYLNLIQFNTIVYFILFFIFSFDSFLSNSILLYNSSKNIYHTEKCILMSQSGRFK